VSYSLPPLLQTLAARGVVGLWTGSMPTILRAALLTASQIPTYDHVKHSLLRAGFQDGYQLHFGSSMIAGVVAALVTSPVDLAKTRIMNGISTVGGIVPTLLQVVRTEGYGAHVCSATVFAYLLLDNVDDVRGTSCAGCAGAPRVKMLLLLDAMLVMSLSISGCSRYIRVFMLSGSGSGESTIDRR